MIYVTHDRGDRICVMKDGHIMQVAEPLTLYNHPDNLFVAGFIGSPPMNFLHGNIERVDSRLRFVETNRRGTAIRICLTDELSRKAEGHVGRPVIFGIRTEDMVDSLTVTGANPDHGMAVKVEPWARPPGCPAIPG
jgi:multiple sugar transport system ATP-binding protein